MSGVAVILTLIAIVAIPIGFVRVAVSQGSVSQGGVSQGGVSQGRPTRRMVAALVLAECAALVGFLLANWWELSNC